MTIADWPATFWMLMLHACWIIFPCPSIPDWVWLP